MDINLNNKDRFNELLFENRNKNYGAYEIRKSYDRRLMLSSLITLSFIVFAMFSPRLFTGVKEIVQKHISDHGTVVIPMTLDPIVHPPKQKPSGGKQVKGSTSTIPVPNDSTKADTTTERPFLGNIGDPKGKDTTDIGIIGNGGNNTIVVVKEKEKIVTSFPDVNPEFPGGFEALAKFIRENMKYPRIALEDGVKGTIYLSFVVDEDGKVIDIKNLNKLGGGLENEAVRVASLMPNWKPGMLGGEKISVRYNLPVKFSPR